MRTTAGNVSSLVRRWRPEATGAGEVRRYPRATVEALQDRLCRGLGIATSNGYLIAIKSFTHWLVRHGRLAADPLAHLAKLNPRTDVRRERRALPEAQLRLLLAAAAKSTSTFQGLVGRDRSILYGLAMTTGYRAGELASLSPSAFVLDDPAPTVTVEAGYSKRRRRDVQPLPRDVADALRGYLAGRPTAAPVWPGSWPDKAAEMLRIDLAAAGLPYLDETGRTADFHGVRHSYITLLAEAGVHPRVAQELARHSDIRLTMGTYTHTHLQDLAGAVEGLPALFGTCPPETLAATGTEGRAPGPNRCESVPFGGNG